MESFDPFALECLAAIMEEGGFERAAQRLSITQSAVSQRLRSLEAQVGTVLIVRSRPLRPTAAAQLLLKHTKQLRLLKTDLERDLSALTASRSSLREHERVSIAINADSIATWALDALGPLVREGLPLEIITDDQDFTQEWLRGGQVIGCVTTLAAPLRGCKVVALGAMNYIAVCAASMQSKMNLNAKDVLTAHRIRDLPFVAFNRKDDLHSEFVARAFGLKTVNLRHLFVPSSQAQVRAVSQGWGASVLPQLSAQAGLDRGDLIRLIPNFSLPVKLYWHCWNLQSTVLNALTAALQSHAKAVLMQ